MCLDILAVPIEVEGERELTITINRDFLRDHAQRCATVMDVMPDRTPPTDADDGNSRDSVWGLGPRTVLSPRPTLRS
jgi:hypothetical protein